MDASFLNADFASPTYWPRFQAADLRGANLTDANAINCDFRGADLRGAT